MPTLPFSLFRTRIGGILDLCRHQRRQWARLATSFAACVGACAALASSSALAQAPAAAVAPAAPVVTLGRPVSPPAWALLERELLRANAAACREFFEKYFDERGFLLCIERWGGDDGPDDAIENCNDWPILHALGASDDVLAMYKKAWEGHLRQFTLAKTVEVPFARDGMYYKEFPVMMDWLHNGEGLTVFNLQGLSDPEDPRFRQRVARYAGFYLNEDPGAQNYDFAHKLIRSMFNGSRGPLLRKATAVDWAGDPIEVKHRFRLGHGEESYQQMLEHFKDYNDIVGDHPQNLLATSLAMNAYMLTHEEKYRTWLLEYVDAWSDRAAANGGILPSNIGLDGAIGGAAGGKWYGGVYGWGFSVYDPGSRRIAHRNTTHLGIVGFMNAFTLTGNPKYLTVWRRQIDAVNAHKKMIDGRPHYPRMHADEGWYDYQPEPYSAGLAELAYLSWAAEDLARVASQPFFRWMNGQNPGFAEAALRADLARVRSRVEAMRADPTTPDTRLSDDPMQFNPASVESLINLAFGGIHPGHRGSILHCRLRYFDPLRRRAGLPEDLAALVESLADDSVTVNLVNVNQLEPRSVVIQAGGYAEHQFTGVTMEGVSRPVSASSLNVVLAPGCGGKLTLRMRRYANAPRLSFPWKG